jgi:transposase
MEPVVLGIDVAKRKFDVALLTAHKVTVGKFDNTPRGFANLEDWLVRYGVERVHACLEATGTYGDALAEHLYHAGHVVSMVNPARIKGFGQSELSRTKTDKADAQLIARFCSAMKPEPWQPLTPEVKELRALVRRLDELKSMLTQEKNRLESADAVVRPSIQDMIDHIEARILQVTQQIRDHIDHHPDLRGKRDLLETIPGIGPGTSAMIIAEFGDVSRFRDAGTMASFCGLTPRQRQSGTSVRGRSMLSKTGSSRIRHALYMPALSAIRYNPVIRAFRARLLANGKHKMIIVGAVMRKLVYLAYGVLKSGKPFDPTLAGLA